MPDKSADGPQFEEDSSVEARATSITDDPNRPVYHFMPVSGWMNDPNGVIHHNGYYHVFFQYNPHDDKWGDIHWGHARSRDLVHWERLPIALQPSTEIGEAHCYSGCTVITAEGRPQILYTSVAPPGVRPFEQWAAIGDDEMNTWRKHAANPLLKLGAEGLPSFEPDWRDPFVFHAGDRTLMALGAATAEQAHVVLFESEDSEQLNWSYRGVLYAQPRDKMRFCECPNFFPLDDKFVLLLSPYRNVEYAIGDFDTTDLTFEAQMTGILDAGVSRRNHGGGMDERAENANYYATNVLTDAGGNCILFGWIRNFLPNQGWNGCLALPRVLTLGNDGRPVQRPAPALERLRSDRLSVYERLTVDSETQALPGVRGDALELQMRIHLDSALHAGARVRTDAEGNGGIAIDYDGATLRVDETVIELPANPDCWLQIFLDRTVAEIFVNDGTNAITHVSYHPVENIGVCVYAEGGAAAFTDVGAWAMATIW